MVLGASVLTVAALYLARDVLIPLTLAILLAFLLNPLVERVRRWGLGHKSAVVLVVGVTLFFVTILAVFVTLQLADLFERLPEYTHNAQQRLDTVLQPLRGIADKLTRSAQEITTTSQAAEAAAAAPVATAPATTPLPETRWGLVLGAVQGITAPLLMLAIVIVLTGAMLMQGADLRDRVVRLIGDNRVTLTTKALDDVAERVSRYLLTQTMINGCQGGVVAIGLAVIGLPNALLWGLLWGLLRFIPYVGPWLGALIPIITALGVFSSWTPILATIGLLVVVEIVTNVVLEPWLYGAGTGLSPLAVLVSALFWAWLWGGVGLLLATPMTVCLAVLGRYVEPLSFLNVLLGDKPALRPSVQLYQRLLSEQKDAVQTLVEEHLKLAPASEVFESALIPALRLVDVDRRNGLLEVEQAAEIYETMEEILDQLPVPAALGGSAVSRLICLPARDAADVLCGRMLQYVCAERGLAIEVIDVGYFANEQADLVAERKPAAVLVSALSVDREAFLRHALKRIAAREPHVELIAGLWQGDHRDAELLSTLGDATGALVVNSFPAAQDALRLALMRSEPNRSPRGAGKRAPVTAP